MFFCSGPARPRPSLWLAVGRLATGDWRLEIGDWATGGQLAVVIRLTGHQWHSRALTTLPHRGRGATRSVRRKAICLHYALGAAPAQLSSAQDSPKPIQSSSPLLRPELRLLVVLKQQNIDSTLVDTA